MNYTPLDPKLLASKDGIKDPSEGVIWNTKGRPPRAVSKEVTEMNNARRISKRLSVKKNRAGEIIQTKKMDLFLEEFLKNGGNATQAALAVFNCTTLESARSMGSVYLKKARGIGRLYLEKKGYGYGKMLDVATEKMTDSKTPEWWDRLMKITEYHDFINKEKSTAPAIVNVIQSHKKVISGYIEGEEEKDISDAEITEEENED